MDTIDIHYQLALDDGRNEEFDIRLHPGSLLPIGSGEDEDAPDWTRLEFQQCPHCPLQPDEHPRCPLALRLLPVVERLSGTLSYQEVGLTVSFEGRSLTATTSAQEAISSLLGLLIATCGCPHTEFLKPMARFHLPLATTEETLYRVFSMYALSRLLRLRNGEKLDTGFDDLFHRYEAMRIVNRSITDRLKSADEDGSTVNAIILLDYVAQLVPGSLDDEIAELEQLFHGFSRGTRDRET